MEKIYYMIMVIPNYYDDITAWVSLNDQRKYYWSLRIQAGCCWTDRQVAEKKANNLSEKWGTPHMVIPIVQGNLDYLKLSIINDEITKH
ncbi:hypothetical protein LPICM17_70058 [Lactococcus piscium]|uniref:hypothetical protein n=1 Tax=Pseudolactococcus carnosus TaxID=2749961 RepID=UPI000BCF19EA|nr:hypothetical protein [Lactococcus carnosus]SOB48984.1 hypothetical protein LPICM17_70058 [Lactococcus piscium]MCJ1973057.1 hypothetical protein [Lactococcus carnosus]MCJ1975569.1 hypothetical protein [Lactococcus carnosus]MCJ1985814.1 hypothetical protein [Lactococcus carnosus]MCJ1987413.1 hypothetical protein [Lactococcus carnosus]